MLKRIDNRMFNGLNKLDELCLRNNQIESIEIVTGDPGNESVCTIDRIMSPSQFKVVKENLFCDLGELRSLSLSSNKFEKLDLNLFCNLKKLESLGVASNLISELNDQVHEGVLTSLHSLNLSSNQLKFIHSSSLPETNSCRLDFSNNELESLDENFFRRNQSLRRLDISYNKLSMRITRDTFFGNLETFEEIELQNNKMVIVEDGALERMTSLSVLSLDLHQSFVGLPVYPRAPLSPYLSSSSSSEDESDDEEDKELYLTLENSTPEILIAFFSVEEHRFSFASVKILELPNCSIHSLDGFDLGKRFPTLEFLGMDNNLLRTVKSSWFDNMRKLRSLSMSENKIDILDDPNLFDNLRALKKINLCRNPLTQIHSRLVKRLENRFSLNFTNRSRLTNFG